MGDTRFLSDPFTNDTASVHLAALRLHATDSLRSAAKVDSIRGSKELHLEKLIAALAEKEKERKNDLRPSVFSKHLLHSDISNPGESKSPSANWTLLIILLVLLLIGMVRQLNNRRLLAFVSAFFASRFAGQLQREEYALNNRTTAALLFSFVLIFSLFIFQLMGIFGISTGKNTAFAGYLLVCACVSLVYLVKILVIRILAFVFKAQNEAGNYIFYILLFNQLLGLVLLPVVTGLTFIRNFDPRYLLYTGLGIISIFFVYRLLRGVSIGLSNPGISRFYLFLYLCTLEFLPVLFAIKYLSMF